MRLRPYIQWYCLLILVASSCGKQEQRMPVPAIDEKGAKYFDNEKELVNWHEGNAALKKKRELGGFEYSVQYLSPDLMALQELKGKITGKAAYEEARSHYTELIYFRMNIKNNDFHQELLKYDLKDAAQYNQRIQYCAFEINRDLMLKSRKDSSFCVLHEFERTFNIESGLNFLLAFPLPVSKDGYTVVYHDKLFGQGIIKFYFDGKNDTPYLKIK
jgi:hypothetical protein